MGQRGKVVKGTESQGDLKFEISESEGAKRAEFVDCDVVGFGCESKVII